MANLSSMRARDIEGCDEQLAAAARREGALRLRLGQALEVANRGGLHFELGFSSLGAYALERCERSVRWTELACCLARRLERLPVLRHALAFGEISWSMVEVLARVATPESELQWFVEASERTVRQMRERVAKVVAGEVESGKDSTLPPRAPPAGLSCSHTHEHDEEDDEVCTLTCTVGQEEAWLFESTRVLLEHMGSRTTEEQVEAMLAEAQGVLLAELPSNAIDWAALELRVAARQHRRDSALGRVADAERRCEALFRSRTPRASVPASGCDDASDVLSGIVGAAAAGGTSLAEHTAKKLDDTVLELARALAMHELHVARLALALQRSAPGGAAWRLLGYATEAQYARERLGMSRSSLLALRGLALRLEGLPAIGAELGAARIGVEAALQIVRVATPRTEQAWLERARKRTVKHLREEVMAASTALRLSGEQDCLPPGDAELEAFHELERAVVSGRVGEGEWHDLGQQRRDTEAGPRRREPGGSAWSPTLSSLADWLERGVQLSAAPRASGAGGVEIRLRVSRFLRDGWRGLEERAQRWLLPGVSWLTFVCTSVWRAWRHMVGNDVAYGEVYERDRYRCSSPVCTRRDVTPHHLQFRSAGGGDEASNVTALCTWCHLFGVHGGRIRATGSADSISWEFPCLRVDGRERREAA